MIREKEFNGVPGLGVLFIWLVLLVASFLDLIWAIRQNFGLLIVVGVLGILTSFLGLSGLFVVNPNEAKIIQFFGKYVGTARIAGLRWANPFYSKKKVSLRTRNFETGKLKVNDKSGNPVEIAAVVVWRVVDTAEAVFNVDDYINFVHVQSESALRNLAVHYGYVADQEGEMALSSHTAEISLGLRGEIQERLEQAGVSVVEARVSHLAYAPEIASAMLQRQQASAVVAARSKIVEGAVGMVEHALQMLSEKNMVVLDDERKAAMVSNLLVVLCGDRHAQPVINAGSIYQ
jgi:regulator of protease activity HflC (stomatin/prohibitin superfamily)